MIKKEKHKSLAIVLAINIVLFFLVNCILNLKYEQVDDFIIYNMYSGLDGAYNMHGIYIHPIICMILSFLFRIIPVINWHTIFLLIMQLICFTTIGYKILKKNENNISSILLYTLFAGTFYTALLLLIQYTSVSALLIGTALFITIDSQETDNRNKKNLVLSSILFAIGIMTRMQSLLIIVPFFAIYAIYYLAKYKRKMIPKQTLIAIAKYYLTFILITIIVYISNIIIYNANEIDKNYKEYNKIRSYLHDLSYVNYEENKELFQEIGWSENDHYLFYTFNFGDEKVYSKENLQKIYDYQKQKQKKQPDLGEKANSLINEMLQTNTYISILIIAIFMIAIYNKKKVSINILIFYTSLAIHMLFIFLNRSMLRVVIPEYIIGTALLIYNLDWHQKQTTKSHIKNAITITVILTIIINLQSQKYNFDYKIEDYQNYKQLINYTNSHKENVYLYTVPSLQYRYLTYSVYEMPPEKAFSNLRVMGGWDMLNQNYYKFKNRYQLEGTFLDLLKENVYLIDGDVTWSGKRYEKYINHIVRFLKENYNIDVTYEKLEEFDNLYIYKLSEKEG